MNKINQTSYLAGKNNAQCYLSLCEGRDSDEINLLSCCTGGVATKKLDIIILPYYDIIYVVVE